MKTLRIAGALVLALAAGCPGWANDISNSTWSETAASNTAAPPNGWPSGTVTPVQVSPMMRETMAAIKRWYNHANAVKTSGGTANAQTLTYDVAPAAYVDGDGYTFLVGPGLTNTGSASLNVNGLGGVTIQVGTATLAAGALVAGRVVTVYYKSSGPSFQLPTAAAAVTTVIACSDLSNDGQGCSDTARAANLVLAGPTTGAAASPTFRALVAADIAAFAPLHNIPVAVGWPATLNPNNIVMAVVNQNSTITAIIGSVEIATGGAATVSVYKAPSATACSAGTVLHSGSFNANGTAATNQTLTLTVTTIAAGERLCLQATGTTAWTAGTGVGTMTVFLAPTP